MDPATLLLGVVLIFMYTGASVLAVSQALKTRHAHHWGHANSALFIGLTVASIVAGVTLATLALWQATAARARTKKLAEERLYHAWIGTDEVDDSAENASAGPPAPLPDA